MEIKKCKVCKKTHQRKYHETINQWMNKKYCSPQCRTVGLSGEKSHFWKGDGVGIDALHVWLHKRIPKPEFCTNCHHRKTYDLANKTGIYDRNLKNWQWLCRRCHMLSDGRFRNLKRGLHNGTKRGGDGRFYSAKM